MITFKTFLSEAAVGALPKYTPLDVKKAIRFLNAKCKDSLWMLQKNKPFYRGDSRLPAGSFLVVDSTKTTRMSQNTTNYYTVILDNIPSMIGFPKRSKSFICSSSIDTAEDFGGNVWVVIPTDSCKIGVVGESDLWRTKVKFGERPVDIEDANRLFGVLNLKPDYESLKKFGEEVKSGVHDDLLTRALERVHSFSPKYDFSSDFKNLKRNFIGTINKAYSPKITGLVACTPTTLSKNLDDTEVWVEGELVFITLDMWDSLLEAYGK